MVWHRQQVKHTQSWTHSPCESAVSFNHRGENRIPLFFLGFTLFLHVSKSFQSRFGSEQGGFVPECHVLFAFIWFLPATSLFLCFWYLEVVFVLHGRWTGAKKTEHVSPGMDTETSSLMLPSANIVSESDKCPWELTWAKLEEIIASASTQIPPHPS